MKEAEMSNKDPIVIASATRTGVGSFGGTISGIPAHELGAIVITEAAKRAKIDVAEINEVILGQVLTAGQGQIQPVRRPSRLVFPKAPPPLASTRFAVPDCVPLPSACSKFFPETPTSSLPVVRKACPFRLIVRICAMARKWVTWP